MNSGIFWTSSRVICTVMWSAPPPMRATGQSTVFGFNASSVAVGFSIGPLIAGGVAATANVETAFGVCAVLGLGLAALVAIGGREPVASPR